jgi:4-amino-4-deoxy-L-arabinose transferase-like glycosyltransferase
MGWFVASTGREATTVAVLAFVLFFVGSSDVPLMPRDEARFGQAAREMLARGDPVVPTFGGVNRYDKPILIYWCVGAAYAVRGVDERAARLPSNLAGAVTVLLVAWSARRRWGPGAGLLAGAMLAATAAFHIQARACTADLLMMLPTTASLLAMERLSGGDGRRLLALVFWLGLALSLLAKGPVGPAFLLCTGVGLWALQRPWRPWELMAGSVLLLAGWWRLGAGVLVVPLLAAVAETVRSPDGRRTLARLGWPWGVPLLLAVVLPWALVAFTATDGEFWRVGVGRHVVHRTLSAMESHGGFPGFYLVTGSIAAFPWFPLIGPGLRSARSDPGRRFLLAWLIAPLFLVELVATKLVHYWMLSYPAGVLLVVGWLRSGGGGRLGWPGRSLLALGGTVLAAVPVAVSLVFGLTDLRPIAVAVGVPMLGATWWAVAVVARHPVRAAAGVVAATCIYLVALLAAFLPALAPHFAGPAAARRAQEMQRPGERIVVYKADDDELFFYLPLDVVNCRPRSCLAELLTTGDEFLGITRVEQLERFRREHPGHRVREVDRIRGLDLVHGTWIELALFRPG